MTDLQKISRMKFGVIDEVFMNTITEAVGDFKNMQPALNALLSGTSSLQTLPPILATIDEDAEPLLEKTWTRDNGDSTTATYAWKYKWKTSIVTTGGDIGISITSGTSEEMPEVYQESYHKEDSTFVGYAYNINEISSFNTGNRIYGIDVTSESYPAGFTPRQQPEGTVIMLTKYMVGRIGDNVFPIFLFNNAGIHDGSCTE